MLGRAWSSRADERRRVSISIALLCGVGIFVVYQAVSSFGCRFPDGGAARTVRVAALERQASEGSSACPKYTDLVDARLLEPGSYIGAARSIRIDCTASEIVVHWAGRDAVFDTLDDETAPNPLGAPRPRTIAAFWPLLPIGCAATLVLAIVAVGAAKLRCSGRAVLARLASASGLVVILVCVGSGLFDLVLAHVAASRPGLARADVARCRARGTEDLLFEATLGLVVGAPGAVLGPLGFRRRRGISSETKGRS